MSEKEIARIITDTVRPCLPVDFARGEDAATLSENVIAALESFGYVIVPLDPTEAMLDAGAHAPPPEGPYVGSFDWMRSRWRAMIEASK